MVTRYNNDTGVGPKEEHIKKFSIELSNNESRKYLDLSENKKSEKFANKLNTNLESVWIENESASLNSKFKIIVSGSYYDIQEHLETHSN